MLKNTELTLIEISNIGFNMAQSMSGHDPQEQFKRIQRMAEAALSEERAREKGLLAQINNAEPESAPSHGATAGA